MEVREFEMRDLLFNVQSSCQINDRDCTSFIDCNIQGPSKDRKMRESQVLSVQQDNEENPRLQIEELL